MEFGGGSQINATLLPLLQQEIRLEKTDYRIKQEINMTQLWLANRGSRGSIDLNETSIKFDRASDKQIDIQIDLWSERLGEEVTIFIGNDKFTLDEESVKQQYDMWLGANDFTAMFRN